MKTSMKHLLAFTLVVAAGCTIHAGVRVSSGGGTGQPSGSVSVPLPDGQATPPAAGQGCQSSNDCSEGETCQGEQGCDGVWTCQPSRICTQDFVPYCGCDGSTYRASSACPNQPYSHRGGCEAQVTAPDGPASPPPPSVGNPDAQAALGEACTTTADCTGGLMCQGGQGCNAAWTCQRPRPCTRDLVPFCGCDNATFTSSSTCPGRRYASRGACSSRPSDGAPVLTPRVGQRCSTQAECGTGMYCHGSQGCGAEWTCQPSRPCTMDRVPYCGCDQQTFFGSSTCPLRPYLQRGPCPTTTN